MFYRPDALTVAQLTMSKGSKYPVQVNTNYFTLIENCRQWDGTRQAATYRGDVNIFKAVFQQLRLQLTLLAMCVIDGIYSPIIVMMQQMYTISISMAIFQVDLG